MADDQAGAPGLHDEILEPLAPTSTVVSTRGRLRWILGFLGVVGLLAGLLVVLGPDGEEDADEALAAAQDVVEGADSYRFELLISTRLQTGDPDGSGSDTTTRSLSTGDVADSQHWHVVEQDAEDYGLDEEIPEYETVRLGDEGYWRSDYDEVPDGIDAPEWWGGSVEDEESSVEDLADYYADLSDAESGDEFDDDYDSYVDEERLALLVDAYLLPISQDPASVKRLISEATDPAVEEHLADGGLRLRAQLAPIEEFVEASGEPLVPVDLVLDLDSADRPMVARFSGSLGQGSTNVEVRYRDWGGVVEVAAPPVDDVDRTPWIQEEVLAAHPELLLAPTTLPAGWYLSYVSTYESSDDCLSVDLTYSTPEEAAAYERMEDLDDEDEIEALFDSIEDLMLTTQTRECADEYDDSAYDEVLGGLPARGEDGYREVVVGDIVVTISTSLDPAVLEQIAVALRPVSVEDLAAMIPETERQLDAYGFGGPFG